MKIEEVDHLDTIVTCRRHDFPCVELQRSDGMVELQCLKYTTCAQVPDLFDEGKMNGSLDREWRSRPRTRMDLSRLPLTT